MFFIVSVGRILLLSASTKHESKSPCSNTSTVHSRRSCQPALRFTWTRRTRDFPYLFSATAIIFSFPDTSCSRLGSAAAGYENALPHFEHEIQFRPADTCHRVCAHRNRPRCRNQDDKARVSALRSRVAAERTGRLDRCGTTSEVANCRRLPAAPIAPEHPSPVALGRYPERASKSASSLQPLSQTNLRDLPLLLRSFLKFGVIVIFQSAPQNLQ